jgi:hypothetical protein
LTEYPNHMYFIYSPYENSSSDFSSHSLVLPALTVGNVGQLTIDVLICTFKCPRVGFIDDPFVLPAVGNDPFTPVRNGILTTKLEGSLLIFEKNKVVHLLMPFQQSFNLKRKTSFFCNNVLR